MDMRLTISGVMFLIFGAILAFALYQVNNPTQVPIEQYRDVEQFAYDLADSFYDGGLSSFSNTEIEELRWTEVETPCSAFTAYAESTYLFGGREVTVFPKTMRVEIEYEVSYQVKSGDDTVTRYRDVETMYDGACFIAVKDGLLMEAGIVAMRGSWFNGEKNQQIVSKTFSTDVSAYTILSWVMGVFMLGAVIIIVVTLISNSVIGRGRR